MTNPISQKQNEVHICADKNMDSVVPSLWGRDHCNKMLFDSHRSGRVKQKSTKYPWSNEIIQLTAFRNWNFPVYPPVRCDYWAFVDTENRCISSGILVQKN